jgi:hypothetical protein
MVVEVASSLSKTPAHITVVVLNGMECGGGEVESLLETLAVSGNSPSTSLYLGELCVSAEELYESKSFHKLGNHCYAVLHTAFARLSWTGPCRCTKHGDGDITTSFQTFQCILQGQHTAVAVGVLNTAPQATSIPPTFLRQRVQQDILQHDVRFLMGVFGDTAPGISAVAKACGAAGEEALCQALRSPEISRQGCLVYPAYIIPFGAKKLTTPTLEDALSLAAFREVHTEMHFRGSLLGLDRIPKWGQQSQQRPQLRPSLGVVKQKKVAEAWMVSGVLSIMLWCGSAKQGRGAQRKSQAKAELKGKGKGGKSSGKHKSGGKGRGQSKH